jgi:hypothetical protein
LHSNNLILLLIYKNYSDESRQLASNMRGIGLTAQDVPEWKKHVIGGKKSSFGMKTNLTLLEQRQSLPIYKLKDELIKVISYKWHTKKCKVILYNNLGCN